MSTTTSHRVARPSSRLTYVGPNWFAAVMGTGIVANAASTLPVGGAGLDLLARVMWVFATILLLALIMVTARHWVVARDVARGHLDHPVMAHFYGAPAMALMTVGAGALLVGDDVIGLRAAIVLSATLWTVASAAGLWTAWVIPRRMRRHRAAYTGPAFGGWLMPVVPPMVSAATGPLLVPHLPPGARPVMLAVCAAMFAAALVASAPVLATIARRVVRGELGAPATIPTLFIVLGPLGQSVTAAHAIGDDAGGAWPVAAAGYGLPVIALALAWLLVVVAITTRAARGGIPFSLTWWSFTFPVGTVVTGLSGLAAQTGSTVLAAAAVGLFAVLVVAWSMVAMLTARGVLTGVLLRAPQTA